MLNLTPILKRDQPTSRIKIGIQHIRPDTSTVEVCHNDKRAFFYVEPIVDGSGNKARLNRNVEGVFDEIDRSKDFLVDPDVTTHDIVDCEAARIVPNEIDPDDLERFLRKTGYLLHPTEEVIPHGDGLATFEVAEMEPSGHTTLRITPTTDLEFIHGKESESGEGATADESSETPSDRMQSEDRLHEGVREIEKAVEETADHEVASLVDDVIGDIETIDQDVQQTTDDEAEEDGSEPDTSDLEMD
ncbi:hypothetical protein [Natronoarchaeum rubrum]|uniref:hypothetical protein n=1 Tax=Natronoarchaeum rubrum TaxID=755311 RepID=UPI0021128BCC|nr:hypothetical protein [Natronoarchaeum rubrum]